MKNRIRWFLIFLSLYLMAGCTTIPNEFQEKVFYRIQGQSAMADKGSPGTGEGLLVKRFYIAPELKTPSFVYRLSPTRFTSDYYNNYITSPARMLTDIIKEDLWASPLFSPAQTMADIHFQLGGKVTQFYGDIQDRTQPKAVITIRLILEKNTGDRFIPVIHKTYGAQILLDAPDPGLLADGLGKGINKILDAFYKDIQAVGLTPPEK